MTVVKRYRYDPGPCLHCVRPEVAHPVEAVPRSLHDHGMPACFQYTATCRQIEGES